MGTERIRTGVAASSGWLYITVTYDGKRMDYFLNGVSDHSRQGPFEADMEWPAKATASWAFGWSAPMGLIADFATWNRALRADEVLGLYRTGAPTPEKTDAEVTTGIPVVFATKRSGGACKHAGIGGDISKSLTFLGGEPVWDSPAEQARSRVCIVV